MAFVIDSVKLNNNVCANLKTCDSVFNSSLLRLDLISEGFLADSQRSFMQSYRKTLYALHLGLTRHKRLC